MDGGRVRSMGWVPKVSFLNTELEVFGGWAVLRVMSTRGFWYLCWILWLRMISMVASWFVLIAPLSLGQLIEEARCIVLQHRRVQFSPNLIRGFAGHKQACQRSQTRQQEVKGSLPPCGA